MSTYLGKYCIVGLPLCERCYKFSQLNGLLSGKELHNGFTCWMSCVFSRGSKMSTYLGKYYIVGLPVLCVMIIAKAAKRAPV